MFLLLIGLIGILSLALIVWITPYGAGVSPDSIAFIRGAQSLLAGKGFSINGQPITHYPPLYSIFLAALGLLENDLVQAARFLNAILFGVNVGLVAALVYLMTSRNFLTAIIAVFFLLTTRPLLELHSMAITEPLYIAFSLACIFFLSVYVENPSLSLLIVSSLCLGFASVTRYIGIAFLPAALVIVYMRSERPQLSIRFRDTLIWCLLSCVPLGILILRNLMVAGSAAGRSLVFHPVSPSQFVYDVFRSMLGFIYPTSLLVGVKPIFITLLVILLVTILIIYFKQHHREINWHSFDVVILVSSLLFSVSYLLFLYISKSFFDAATPVDNRIMSPIFLTLSIGIFSIIWIISQTLKKPMVWWSFLFFLVLSISIRTPKAILFAINIQKDGLYYTSRQWRDSESIKFVKSLADDVRVYSNGPDPVGFLAEKQSLSLPYKYSYTTHEENFRFTEQMRAMCNDITENKAILLYFKKMNRPYLATREDVESNCQLSILRRFKDGIVYGK